MSRIYSVRAIRDRRVSDGRFSFLDLLQLLFLLLFLLLLLASKGHRGPLYGACAFDAGFQVKSGSVLFIKL